MGNLQTILVTGPELGHNTYEAHFDQNNFLAFKKKVGIIVEMGVTPDELKLLSECDYPTFCEEIKKRIGNLTNKNYN